MSSASITTSRPAPAPTALAVLARLEMCRYAFHPLFLLGLVVTVVLCIPAPDAQMTVMGNSVVPAAAIGVLGIVIMASLTRGSQTIVTAAGVVTVPERTRTLALAVACVVPFTVGLAWWVSALAAYRHYPPPPNGFPFRPASDVWAAAVLFGQGPLACLGGPMLGLVVGRWLGGRGAPALTAVTVVAACIVMQGLFVPLRRVRVVMPWTYFGGPYGADGDPNRMLVLPGSPFWWVAYLACLCTLALLAALLHDRENRRGPLLAGTAAVLVVGTATVLLAMWTGIPHTLVNPLPSP